MSAPESHSPLLPLKLSYNKDGGLNGGYWSVTQGDGSPIVHYHLPLIVGAVNAHSRLVEALQQLHDDRAEYARINNLGGYDNQVMVNARAALAAAKGEA